MESIARSVRDLFLKPNKQVVFLDLEYINAGLYFDRRPFSNEWKEIIEFNAVKMDFANGGTMLDKFSQVVNPKIYGSQLDKECWQLMEQITGLSYEKVKNGPDLVNVFASFCKFTENCIIVIMSEDEQVLKDNLNLLDHDLDLKFIRLKTILAEHKELNSCRSGELYKFVGLSEEDIFIKTTRHNALFNATSMALFVKYFINN